LRIAGAPTSAMEAAKSSGPETEAKPAIGMPNDFMKFFSFSRSCATSSALMPGRTGRTRSTATAASTGTFSNS
jgi:hypothetical protein